MTVESLVRRKNGLKLLSFILLVCPSWCLPDGDLCKWMNGRKYYIDVGESGIISAENVTSQSATASPSLVTGSASSATPSASTTSNNKDQQQQPSDSNQQPQIPQRCSVELITCPSCHFRMKTIRINIPTCSSDKSCRCDFVWVKEAAYSKSGQEFCGYVDGNSSDVMEFESKTKLVSVDFLYSGTYSSAFALQFSAIKNVYVYKGGYEHFPNNSTGEISSPSFPGGYPSDYSAEYILQNVNPSGLVQLLFTDFQLSLWSYMEILDSNGSRIDVYNGNTFRPPALISSGPTMTVKFQANDEYPSSGFLASYAFVGYSERYWINRPSTECGGFVEDYGGAITMMNMVPSNMMRAFDCVWLIHPRNSHVPGKQISVRVSQFDEMGAKSTLSIRQGLYSKSPILETVTPFHHHKIIHRGQEYVVPASVGFYIRLVGFFSNKSHLAIIYSTFHYDNCYALGDFECGNGRCIKNSLRCDGFNHCGDGTDESSCFGNGAQQGTPSPEDANWWRTLTPNYYFPKTDSGGNTGTNTLILVTSLAGLGMFVLTTVVILVKLHKQRQDDHISREILQTISADIEAENSSHLHRVPSDPPMYDPPPSYDDVIKFYLPPPPAYSNIGTNHGRNGGPTDHGSRPDGGGTTSNMKTARTRRKKPSSSSRPIINTTQNHHENQQIVLRVALPEETEEQQNNGAADANAGSYTSPWNEHQQNGSASAERSSHAERAKNSSTSAKESNWKTIRKIANLNHVNDLVPYKSSLLSSVWQQTKQLPDFQSSRSAADSHCECQGACSCTPIDCITPVPKDKRTVTSSEKSGLQVKTASSDELNCVVRPNDDSSPNKPPRSKSFCDDQNQRHQTPEAPSETRTKETIENASNHSANLRRSSSGPSEVPRSLTAEYQHKSADSTLNIAQVKNLASAIFGGLQQSFASSEAQQARSQCSDRGPSPNVWGSLWLGSTKKKSDKEVPAFNNGKDCSSPSDTQPLIIEPLSKKNVPGTQAGSSAVEEVRRNPRVET